MTETSISSETAARSDVQLILDSDIVEYFEAIDNYEDVINEILRTYVEDKKNRS